MKILAIDTTAKTATVALCEDTKLIAEYSALTASHSTHLLPMTESVLSFAGISVDDIDLYAVSAGPGSFTGVRIGVSTVKGLAFKNSTPCIGVSALEAMAANFAGIDGIIVPVIDARRDTVYSAIFRSDREGNVLRLTEDMQISIDELFLMLSEYGKALYFTGDAYDKIIAHPACPTRAVTPEKLTRQSAYGVALTAYLKWQNTEDKSEFTDTNLAPVYLKKSQAERELEEKTSNGDK